MLDVPIFGQREVECGTTSLKAVAWFHRKQVSARRLSRLCRVSSEGVDHHALVLGAVATGATVFDKSGGSTRELRWFLERGYPLIVGWWSMDPEDSHFDPRWRLRERRRRDCGHFSVVCGMTDRSIWLMDPQWTTRAGRLRVVGRRRLPLGEFRAVWYDTDTAAYRLVKRWYMVVNYEGTRFALQIGGGRDYAPRRRRGG